jgi:hypothetical protein
MQIYLGNQKINRIYNGDRELIVPTTEASINNFTAEYLLIAEGGVGGDKTDTGINGLGGGGSGGLLSGSLEFTYASTYNVVIDTGNGNSTFRGLTAIVGGNGGEDNNPADGGGSGGGAAAAIATGGSGVAGQGNKGGNCAGSNLGGGGGGGALTEGDGTTGGAGPGKGGDGKQSAISGVLTYYSGGGGGGYRLSGVGWVYASNGLGGGDAHYGGGSRANAESFLPSGRGICIVRYKGPQKATGGTITTDGDYIIHTFNFPDTVDLNQPFTTFSKSG